METLTKTWLFIANSEASKWMCNQQKYMLTHWLWKIQVFICPKKQQEMAVSFSTLSAPGTTLTYGMLLSLAVSVYVAVRIYELHVIRVWHISAKNHISQRDRERGIDHNTSAWAFFTSFAVWCDVMIKLMNKCHSAVEDFRERLGEVLWQLL